MSVQRYTADGYGAQQGEMMPDPEGPWMLAADHARIVAEATAEARAAERRHWEARFRNAEQGWAYLAGDFTGPVRLLHDGEDR